MLLVAELAVAALGWWQHRSIEALTVTETKVLRSAMRERAVAFTESFDRQVESLISALSGGSLGDLDTSSGRLAASLAQWRREAAAPELLREVWRVREEAGVRQWRQFDGRHWTPADERDGIWELCQQSRLELASPLRLAHDAIVLPGLEPLTALTTTGTRDCLVAFLHRDRLRGQMVKILLQRHLTGNADLEQTKDRYLVAIRDLRQGQFITGPLRGEAEVRLPFLFAKPDRLNPVVRVEEFPPADRPRILPLVAPPVAAPAWELLVSSVSGSVENQVRSTRWLNFAAAWALSAALGLTLALAMRAWERSNQLQAQQAQFVAAISHELRSPVAAIRTLAQNQADGLLANLGQTAEYGRLLVGQADRLRATFEHCLAFAGVESVATVPKTRVDAAAIVQALCHQFRKAHPEMSIAYHGEDSAWVCCSRDLLEQALRNLLENARKFAGSGGAVAEVTVERQAGDLVITVRDEGIGVLPRELAHLGTPFFRGQQARDGQIAGLGLGLSLVRSFAVRHGGSLRLERRKGPGLSVILKLPGA